MLPNNNANHAAIFGADTVVPLPGFPPQLTNVSMFSYGLSFPVAEREEDSQYG